ncbi:MAG TPA: metallophosphoesterase family protein, partial [Pseudonocardiaceae bacterium]|nr:metallophosphoesterase family protein [Pseudonocardiaceae bacterium]
TDEQPAPHATPADAVGSVDLVQRYGAMAAGIAWTRGVLDQAGSLTVLDQLPTDLRFQLPGGIRVLGVHATPRADDGQGIDPDVPDDELGPLLAGCGADVVVGGHMHVPTDRILDGVRALNPGSVGIPRTCGIAGWLLLADDGASLSVEQRSVPFDVAATVEDLRRRRHPNADFVSSILTGRRQQVTTA